MGRGELEEWSSPGGQLEVLSAELDIKMFSLGVSVSGGAAPPGNPRALVNQLIP